MRIAVVGSGAAASGVLAGIERFAPTGAEVTVLDIGLPMEPHPEAPRGRLDSDQIAAIYARLRQQLGLSFPPPKSHFGQSLSKYPVDGHPVLWKSEHRGGLTNFWGGGMFPFTDQELAGWPIRAADLDPHYQIIADQVGVCGEPDALNRYFPKDYVNRPPLRTSPAISALQAVIDAHGEGDTGAYRILAGSSRLALDTREGQPSGCVYTGECMLGCLRGAVWSAGRDLDRLQAQGTVSRYLRGRVLRFANQTLVVEDQAGGRETLGTFDRIYLAAGCIGSTEIAMRSLGIGAGPVMRDSAILSFPILYLGGAGGLLGGERDYFSLCNLSIMALPREALAEAGVGAAQVSVYPAFDHLFRYYSPRPLWGLLAPLWRLARWRLMLGRVYLADAADRLIEFRLENDRLSLHRGPAPALGPMYKDFLRSLRRAANHAGFWIPPTPALGHGSSSHYAGTLPYGGDLVPVAPSGRIAPGVYLADAAAFPSLPALSPTFTIMANACRTVQASLAD